MTVEAGVGRGLILPKPVESTTPEIKQRLMHMAESAREAFLDFVDLSRTPEAGGNGEILLGPAETRELARQMKKIKQSNPS